MEENKKENEVKTNNFKAVQNPNTYNSYAENKKTKHLVNINLIISSIICISSIIVLLIYNKYYISAYLFDIAIVLFRTGLFVATFSIIFGIFFDNYLNN